MRTHLFTLPSKWQLVRYAAHVSGVLLLLLLLCTSPTRAQSTTEESSPATLPEGIFEQTEGPYLSNLSATGG